MAILNNILKGQLIWSNHLEIFKIKNVDFLRHPVCYLQVQSAGHRLERVCAVDQKYQGGGRGTLSMSGTILDYLEFISRLQKLYTKN